MTSIVCARCGKKDQKTGHFQKYCTICQPIVKREQKTEAERRRRAKKGDEINTARRVRYAFDEDYSEKLRTSAKKFYQEKVKPDPARAELHRKHTSENMRTFRTAPGWREVFERDGENCTICGSTRRLGIHHKDGMGSTIPLESRNNALDNLVLICQSCHMKIHAPYKERLNVKKKY